MKEFEEILGTENVLYNEPMSKHTSFKVGGNVDIFLKVNSFDKLQKIIEISKANNLPITVVGNGSNLLVSDKGIRGVVIKYIADNCEYLSSDIIEVEAGAINGAIAYGLLNKELSGFEFASGIPGTIGGAIFMNAGAYGSEMKDIVVDVTYLDICDNRIKTIENKDCEFSYRSSFFCKDESKIIVKAKLKLTKATKQEIQSKMDEYREKRIETQPLNYPSAGSTFKRGNGFVTARLIDEAGLKGYKIGGAQVSEKHAGFIINTGDATAKDVLDLIDYVKQKVYEKFNVKMDFTFQNKDQLKKMLYAVS